VYVRPHYLLLSAARCLLNILDEVRSTFKLLILNAITYTCVLQALFSVAIITQTGMCKTCPITFIVILLMSYSMLAFLNHKRLVINRYKIDTYLTWQEHLVMFTLHVIHTPASISYFYGKLSFIAVFTRFRPGSLFWSAWVRFTPHPAPYTISLRSILIVSSHLHKGHPSDLLPSGFPTKILYGFLIATMRATCPIHIMFLDFITLIIFGEEHKLWRSSLLNILHPPVTSFLSGEDIFLSTLFINTSTYASPLMCETKFHNHTDEQIKL